MYLLKFFYVVGSEQLGRSEIVERARYEVGGEEVERFRPTFSIVEFGITLTALKKMH